MLKEEEAFRLLPPCLLYLIQNCDTVAAYLSDIESPHDHKLFVLANLIPFPHLFHLVDTRIPFLVKGIVLIGQYFLNN